MVGNCGPVTIRHQKNISHGDTQQMDGFLMGKSQSINAGWWLVVSTIWTIFHHIWDVIPTPLTNSIIFQDGRHTTNQINSNKILDIRIIIHQLVWKLVSDTLW